MPLPSSIDDLSTTAGSNSPAGSESPGTIDDYLRVYASYIAQLRDGAMPLTSRNVKMSVPTASATATLTADEIVVKSGTSAWLLSGFSKTINISTTGAGGMDTGIAPAGGFVCIYAIYNPTTKVSALLACGQTVSDGSTYTGLNMPAGYTASALVSIWPVASGPLLNIGLQVLGTITRPSATALNNSTIVGSLSSLSLSGLAPNAAKTVSGLISLSSTAVSSLNVSLFPSATFLGGSQQFGVGSSPAGATQTGCFNTLPVASPGVIGFITASSAGTPTFQVLINAYTIF